MLSEKSPIRTKKLFYVPIMGIPSSLCSSSHTLCQCVLPQEGSFYLPGFWQPYQVTPMHGPPPHLAPSGTLHKLSSPPLHMDTLSPCTGFNSSPSSSPLKQVPCPDYGYHPVLGCSHAWLPSLVHAGSDIPCWDTPLDGCPPYFACQLLFLVQTCKSYFVVSIVVLPHF